MRSSLVFVVGPFPPPVNGFSYATACFSEILSREAMVERFDTGPFVGILKKICLWLKYFALIFKEKDVRVYIAFNGGRRQWIDLMYIIPAVLMGRGLFIHHHTFEYLCNVNFRARVVIRFARSANHIVLCNCHADLLSKSYAVSMQNILTLTNAALLNNGSAASRNAISSNCKMVLGYLSLVSAGKGVFDFIDICRALRRSGVEFEAKIVGPILPADADRFAAENGRGEFEYLGPLYGDSKIAFLLGVDILIFPSSLNEAEPVSIIESLDCGVVVISRDRGCVREIAKPPALYVLPDDNFLDSSVILINELSQAWCRGGLRQAPIDAFSSLASRGKNEARMVLNRICQ